MIVTCIILQRSDNDGILVSKNKGFLPGQIDSFIVKCTQYLILFFMINCVVLLGLRRHEKNNNVVKIEKLLQENNQKTKIFID